MLFNGRKFSFFILLVANFFNIFTAKNKTYNISKVLICIALPSPITQHIFSFRISIFRSVLLYVVYEHRAHNTYHDEFNGFLFLESLSIQLFEKHVCSVSVSIFSFILYDVRVPQH